MESADISRRIQLIWVKISSKKFLHTLCDDDELWDVFSRLLSICHYEQDLPNDLLQFGKKDHQYPAIKFKCEPFANAERADGCAKWGALYQWQSCHQKRRQDRQLYRCVCSPRAFLCNFLQKTWKALFVQERFCVMPLLLRING